MTTATKLTPGDVRDRLRGLLQAAADRAVAEERMERIKAELQEHEDDWADGLAHFAAAAVYEVKAALSYHERADSTLLVCQDVQDAIDVLSFAMERDDAC